MFQLLDQGKQTKIQKTQIHLLNMKNHTIEIKSMTIENLKLQQIESRLYMNQVK